MEDSTIDILLEFIEVCIHSILFFRNVYPESIFTLKKKYNIPIHVSLYPELNKYISEVLRSVKPLLASNNLQQLLLCILDSSLNPVENFVFNNFYFDPSKQPSETSFTELTTIFRTFILKILTSDRILKPAVNNYSFRIYVKTEESTSMKITADPAFEKFPWIAQDQLKKHKLTQIFPLQTIKTALCHLEMFVEL